MSDGTSHLIHSVFVHKGFMVVGVTKKRRKYVKLSVCNSSPCRFSIISRYLIYKLMNAYLQNDIYNAVGRHALFDVVCWGLSLSQFVAIF